MGAAGRARLSSVLLLLPALVLVVGAVAYPIGMELWLSVSNAQVGERGSFLGLANYQYLAAQGTYRDAVLNTLVYNVASIAVKVVLGLAIALGLARPFPGRRLVYALVFLPFAFPTVTGTMAWYYLLSNVHGAIDTTLMALRVTREGVDWLGSPGPLPMASLVTVNVWHGVGLFVVLLLSGLRSISADVLDAARVDGAGAAGRFLHIVLPALRPALVLASALSVMGTFGDFAIVHVLTNGGPANHTQTVPHMAFAVALRDGDLGVSAAIALTMMPVYLLVLAYLVRTVVRR